MNNELTQKLFKKYPKIFPKKNRAHKGSLMSYGFECGDGWYWLIDSLCDIIQRYYDANSKRKGFKQPVAEQVKEKFGALRFYTTDTDPAIHSMIAFTEELSVRICEDCGAIRGGKTKPINGWYKALCEKCYKKQIKRK